MNKTTAILVVAALAAVAMAPTAQSDLLTRSFLDEALHTDLGTGWGLYDPDPDYCLALLGFVTWAGVGVFYYPGVRYWNTAASAPVPVPATSLGPEPTNCLDVLFPPPPVINPDTLNVGPASVEAGGAFHIRDLLGANEVANLAKTFVDVQYCTGTPAVVGGTPAIAGLPPPPNEVGLFTALDVVCGNAGGDDLYPAACGLFSLVAGIGTLNSDAPIMLADGGCNSLQNSPGGVEVDPLSSTPVVVGTDYVFERCTDTEIFNVLTGVGEVEWDTDFATVLVDTTMAAWVTQVPGTVPDYMFPHVSNLEQDNRDCNGGARGNTPVCSDGLDNDGDTLTDFPADPQCTSAGDLNESA